MSLQPPPLSTSLLAQTLDMAGVPFQDRGSPLASLATHQAWLAWFNQVFAALQRPFLMAANTYINLIASGSWYIGPGQGIESINATETNARVLMTRAAAIASLSVSTVTAQPASGTLVFTVYKNGSATALVLTIAANAAAGVYSAAQSITVAAGDFLSIRAQNNASGTSATLNAITLEFS